MENIGEFYLNNWLLILLWSTLLYMIITTFSRGKWELSPQQVVRMMNKGNGVIVDVRENNELSEGYIDKSVHIPMGDVKKRIKELEKYKEKEVVIGCRSGHRSARILGILRKAGFASVYTLRGGILAWQNENLPLIKK